MKWPVLAVIVGFACVTGAVLGPPEVPWERLNDHQRGAFMRFKVVPAMRPVFQNHDPKEFSKFGCETCHGKDARKRKFEMPNPQLPKLDFEDLSEFKQADLDWMEHEVKPRMARLLGVSEWSKDNPTGFGCLNCHLRKAPGEPKHDH